MNDNLQRMLKPTAYLTLSLAIATLMSCAGPLFKVKPVVELPALPAAANSVSGAGLVVRTAPLLTDEDSQGLFEANLPAAGVLPVRLELVYETGGVPLELKRARFRVRDSEGREWKALQPKQAVARILKANDIYVFNPNSRKQFESEFSAYWIDLKTPLTNAESRRQGFLFFETPAKEPVRTKGSLTLEIKGLAQPLEITLN